MSSITTKPSLRAIKLYEPALVLGNPTVTRLGNYDEDHVFKSHGACAAFLANYNPRSFAEVSFGNMHYNLPPWSISILPDCKNTVYNTARMGAQTARMKMTPVPVRGGFSWQAYNEETTAFEDSSFMMVGLLEKINATRDVSNYLWYMTDESSSVVWAQESLVARRRPLTWYKVSCSSFVAQPNRQLAAGCFRGVGWGDPNGIPIVRRDIDSVCADIYVRFAYVVWKNCFRCFSNSDCRYRPPIERESENPRFRDLQNNSGLSIVTKIIDSRHNALRIQNPITVNMGRKRHECWKHVTAIPGGNPNKKRWQGNYFHKDYAGGALRIRVHLGLERGQDIEICKEFQGPWSQLSGNGASSVTENAQVTGFPSGGPFFNQDSQNIPPQASLGGIQGPLRSIEAEMDLPIDSPDQSNCNWTGLVDFMDEFNCAMDFQPYVDPSNSVLQQNDDQDVLSPSGPANPQHAAEQQDMLAPASVHEQVQHDSQNVPSTSCHANDQHAVEQQDIPASNSIHELVVNISGENSRGMLPNSPDLPEECHQADGMQVEMLAPKLVGRDQIVDELWGYLTTNDILCIGVYGMGGVGKTTTMKHLYNKVHGCAAFENVFWVTVSKDCSIHELQNKIAKAIKTLGSNLPPSLKLVAEDIVKECKGLPLAIVVMVGSMRGEVDDHVWEATLKNLKRPGVLEQSMKESVFPILVHSYNRLNKKKQLCFLTCALFPEDSLINRTELIELCIDEGVIREDRRRKMYNEGHRLLGELEKACLLERMLELKVIDLRLASITEVPKSVENLEKLNALVLSFCCQLSCIPSLAKLTSLRKLELLWRESIKEVPDSLGMLINLTYLCLRERRIERIPDGVVGKLKKLQHLEADYIAVKGGEVGKLRKLEVLRCRFENVNELNEYTLHARTIESYRLVIGACRNFNYWHDELNFHKVIIMGVGEYKIGETCRLLGDMKALGIRGYGGTWNISSLMGLEKLEELRITGCDEVSARRARGTVG
ncbi:hypothetical protein CRG98_035655 [Punica granatum]|uniref:NB-ARC domain-containing protein n=1 Tax=Punica granatum TaxID=22663 RepID=A0A2I0IIY2_PUNGR|nr:hypothetical protein CRG98_035655 [Punica granatum]